MASETGTSPKTNQRRKKAAVLALAGVIGIGAAATMANWTDERAAGASMEAGKFDLQIATTAVGQTPAEADWKSNTSVENIADLGLKKQGWGPGDSDEAAIHVRLGPGTTHNAELTSEHKNTSDHWIVEDDVKSVTLEPGQPKVFNVSVQMDNNAPDSAQGADGEVTWKFTAEQQSDGSQGN